MMDVVRSVDPVAVDEFDSLAETPIADEVLERILASATSRSRSAESRLMHGRRRRRALVAIATVLLVGGLVLILGDARAPSAEAAVRAAAEATARSDSGQLAVTIDMTRLPEQDTTESGSVVRAHIEFQGDDYRWFNDASALAPRGTDADSLVSTTIKQSGITYLQTSDGPWSEVDDPELLPDLDGLNDSVRQLQVLLANAADLEETARDEGSVTYSGTLTADALRDTNPEDLPLGVSFLQSQLLPDTLGLLITVSDGQLVELVVTIAGVIPQYGTVDITVTSAYSDLGEAQRIEKPAPLVPFLDVDEAIRQRSELGGREVRLVGTVSDEPRVGPDDAISFTISSGDADISVLHSGPHPAFELHLGGEVILVGRFTGAGLESTEVWVNREAPQAP